MVTAMCGYGHVLLQPCMVMAMYGYGHVWLWPCMVMAMYGYGHVWCDNRPPSCWLRGR